MSKNIKELSPDHEATVAYFFLCEKGIEKIAEEIEVETTKGKGKVPISILKGRFDEIRAHLLAEVDCFLDRCEYFEERKDESLRRKEIKKTHKEDGKPLVWVPKGGQS